MQQPSRTLLQLTSGRLQELAECIDRAGPCTTIDLCGGTFSGPLQHPAMKLSAADVAIVNGQLLLQPEQYITVTARGAQMTDVVIGAAPGAGLGAAVPSPRVHKPAVLVTKQSYAAGGELALLRCRVELGDRAHGLQVGRGGVLSVTYRAPLMSGVLPVYTRRPTVACHFHMRAARCEKV